jgi:hypothetical protein
MTMKPTYTASKALPPGWRWPTHQSETGSELQLVRCQWSRCGRPVWSDTAASIARLPDDVRRGARYVCDGCLQRLLERDIEVDDAARRMGAPASRVREMKVQREAKRATEKIIHIERTP